MKNILILSLLLLSACTRSGAVPEIFNNLPEELSDCKFFRLTDINGSQSLIARCPNSVTTTKKVDSKLHDNIVIDIPAVSAVTVASSVEANIITASSVEITTPIKKPEPIKPSIKKQMVKKHQPEILDENFIDQVKPN